MPGSQSEYVESNRRKYVRDSDDASRGGRKERRYDAPSPTMPSFPPSSPAPPRSGQVWGPIVDMAEIQRGNAIWIRGARGERARLEEAHRR